MKAIILARVSTEEQKEAGNSLPAQIIRLKDYCKRKNLEIIKEYSFDESAYKTKRDGFDKILDYLKTTAEKVVVCFDKVDRFSRNVFDKRVAYLYELAMTDKIEIHFASDNLVISPNISATEKFHFGMNLGLAKYYSDAISDNVKRAYENKIKEGEWIGKAPFGYLNIEDEKGNKEITPDPVRGQYVVKIFEMYASGNASIQTIKKEMARLGVRSNTKTPTALSNNIIFHILNNPFYYGMMRIKDKLYPHRHGNLISKALFEKAQEVRTGWHKKPFKYASKPYILRGMIKCADCGCTITPERAKEHIYYSCTNYKKMHDKRIYVREEDLMKPIKEVLKNIQLSDEKIKEIVEGLRETNESQNKFNERAINNLRQEYDKIQKRISGMMDLRFDGSITEEIFDQKLKEYKERQYEIDEELKRHTFADETYYTTINTVLSLAQRAYEIFESSEVDEKRQLLNFILQNLELKGKKLLFNLKTPFDTVLLASRCSQMLRGWDSNPRPID